MKLTRQLIDKYAEKNEWLSELNHLLDQIEQNKDDQPDLTIECCKSILESIAKNSISRLDSSYPEREINDGNLSKLMRKAKDELLVHHNEEKFLSVLNNWSHHLCELRNNSGEVSHGKILPKMHRNEPYFVEIAKNITDGFSAYMLHLLLAIDLSYKDPLKYEDNPEFNDELDVNNPMSVIVYSKALFDQDLIAYEEQLLVFNEAEEMKLYQDLDE